MLIKLFKEYNLEFTELFECDTYVYMWNKHPLAEKSIISIDELEDFILGDINKETMKEIADKEQNTIKNIVKNQK